jgi:hypothetical protein
MRWWSGDNGGKPALVMCCQSFDTRSIGRCRRGLLPTLYPEQVVLLPNGHSPGSSRVTTQALPP